MEPGSDRPPAPARVHWAVDVLAPCPEDQVLEVGGGPGVSAALICRRLTTGRLLAVDRSAVACRRTRRRNVAHLSAGRLEVQERALESLVVPPDSVDKALALDVNLFWVRDPQPELTVLSRALRPGGALHVLYGAGGPTGAQRVTATVSAALREHGFVDVRVIGAAAGFGVSARTPPR